MQTATTNPFTYPDHFVTEAVRIWRVLALNRQVLRRLRAWVGEDMTSLRLANLRHAIKAGRDLTAAMDLTPHGCPAAFDLEFIEFTEVFHRDLEILESNPVALNELEKELLGLCQDLVRRVAGDETADGLAGLECANVIDLGTLDDQVNAHSDDLAITDSMSLALFRYQMFRLEERIVKVLTDLKRLSADLA